MLGSLNKNSVSKFTLAFFIIVLMVACGYQRKPSEISKAGKTVFISMENHLVDPQIYDPKRMLWGTEHGMFPFKFCSTQSNFRCILMDNDNVKLAWPRNLKFEVRTEWKYRSRSYISEPFELGLECEGNRNTKFLKLIATNQEQRTFYVISSSHRLVMMGVEYLPDETLLGPEIAKRKKEILEILRNEGNIALTQEAIDAYERELNRDYALGLRFMYIASTNCGLLVP